jgi:hypothetical protein
MSDDKGGRGTDNYGQRPVPSKHQERGQRPVTEGQRPGQGTPSAKPPSGGGGVTPPQN